MSRYIDADAVWQTLPDDLPFKASVKRVLMQAPPADVVEVVRCKDCKYSVYYSCKNDACYQFTMCRRRECYSEGVEEDDFCSYGERREG